MCSVCYFTFIPLCTHQVTLEFHPNDDASVNLSEIRFHIPSTELEGDVDPVDAFREQVSTPIEAFPVTVKRPIKRSNPEKISIPFLWVFFR